MNGFMVVSVSVALSFELSLSSIREMPPVFQCQDFPNSGYPELCALIERNGLYRNRIFFQVHSLLFWMLTKNLFCFILLFRCFFDSLDFFSEDAVGVDESVDIFRFPGSTE